MCIRDRLRSLRSPRLLRSLRPLRPLRSLHPLRPLCHQEDAFLRSPTASRKFGAIYPVAAHVAADAITPYSLHIFLLLVQQKKERGYAAVLTGQLRSRARKSSNDTLACAPERSETAVLASFESIVLGNLRTILPRVPPNAATLSTSFPSYGKQKERVSMLLSFLAS